MAEIGSLNLVCCSICLDLAVEDGEKSWSVTDCGHCFHTKCVEDALAMLPGSCPICRKHLPSSGHNRLFHTFLGLEKPIPGEHDGAKGVILQLRLKARALEAALKDAVSAANKVSAEKSSLQNRVQKAEEELADEKSLRKKAAAEMSVLQSAAAAREIDLQSQLDSLKCKMSAQAAEMDILLAEAEKKGDTQECVAAVKEAELRAQPHIKRPQVTSFQALLCGAATATSASAPKTDETAMQEILDVHFKAIDKFAAQEVAWLEMIQDLEGKVSSYEMQLKNLEDPEVKKMVEKLESTNC